jgi:predicted  nucleic acid-binding Zn-ribbon protein
LFKAYNKQKTNLKERQIKLTEEIKKFTKENKKLDETISAERKKMHHISNQGIIKEIGCAR